MVTRDFDVFVTTPTTSYQIVHVLLVCGVLSVPRGIGSPHPPPPALNTCTLGAHSHMRKGKSNPSNFL
jgi:hypothetical protein